MGVLSNIFKRLERIRIPKLTPYCLVTIVTILLDHYKA